MQVHQFRPATRQTAYVTVDAGAKTGWWRVLSGAALAMLATLTIGCAEAVDVMTHESLDGARRTRVTGGIGAATLNPGAPPMSEAEDVPADISSAVSFQAGATRRLTSPERVMALGAGLATHVVTESRMVGGPASGCRLHWSSVGPVATIEAPSASRVWFSGDLGVAAVWAVRSDCAVPGYPLGDDSAVRVSPSLGFSINFGVTRRFGWNLGGHWVRIPLDEVGLATGARWGGAGAISAVIAF